MVLVKLIPVPIIYRSVQVVPVRREHESLAYPYASPHRNLIRGKRLFSLYLDLVNAPLNDKNGLKYYNSAHKKNRFLQVTMLKFGHLGLKSLVFRGAHKK